VLLEHDLYLQWCRDITSNGFPGLQVFEPIDVLTTIIWTTSIVHGSDHISYSNIFQYWPMYSAPVDVNLGGTWQDVLNNQYEAYRTRVFIDMYCAFRFSMFKSITQDMLTSPHLYDGWKSIAQKENLPELRKIHAEFRNDLRELNKKWGWLLDVKTVPASTCF